MPSEGQNSPRLSDLASELFAFTFQLKASKDPGSADEVKQKVGNLMADFEQAARSAGFKAETTREAKYALAAFIDETVLASKFPMKDEWAGSPLQLEYFNDFAAGEEFYNKLNKIREGTAEDRLALLEVFFLCLTHGFKGMYIDLKGMEERRQLLTELGSELKGRIEGSEQLSPSWQPPDDLPKLVRSSPAWIVPVVCLILFIALLVALAFTIDVMAGSAAETIVSGNGQ